jgi:hypothetical protein
MLGAALLILHSVTVPGTNLDVRLSSQVGTPYNAETVEKDVRYLWSLDRFDDVRVEEPEPGALVFHVTPKRRVLLHEVRLEPNSFGLEISLPEGTLVDDYRAHLVAIEARKQLQERGYPTAEVRESLVPTKPGYADLHLKVIPGPNEKRHKPPRLTEGPKDLCRALLVERRDAYRQGILDFNAEYTDGHLTVDRGPVYHVGRIEFTGNHHYSDSTIRRHFVLDEGALFDDQKLRLSIARLNRAGIFEPLDSKHVVVSPNPDTGYADIALHLTERKRGSWKLSGPVGPASLAGPLQASIMSRLPWWTSYTLSVSVLALAQPLIPGLTPVKSFIPIGALQRPFMPGLGWMSGFTIAPQLGWRNTGAAYVATQITQRLSPRLSGERSAQPPLAVQVGDTVKYCEAPKPRLHLVRTGAGVALNFLGALPVL